VLHMDMWETTDGAGVVWARRGSAAGALARQRDTRRGAHSLLCGHFAV